MTRSTFSSGWPISKQRLQAWVGSGALQDEVANKLQEWFVDGLRDWDITRDAPYFGFRIPGTEDKYLLRLGGRAGGLHGQLP